MRHLLFAFLMLAAVGFGATYYVDPAKADDSGDGTTAETAEKTLVAALDDAADGDTIRLLPGTYTAYPVLIDDAGSTKSVTIMSDSTQVTLLTNSAYGSVYVSNDATGKTITFDNINFSIANAGNRFIYFTQDKGGSLAFEDCVFTQGTTNKPLTDGFPADSATTSRFGRNLSLLRCTFACNVNNAMTLRHMERCRIEDCDITGTYNTSGGITAYIAGYIGSLEIINNDFDVQCNLFDCSSTAFDVKHFIVEGNRITHSAICGASTDYTVYFIDEPNKHFAFRNNTVHCSLTSGAKYLSPLKVGALSAAYTETYEGMQIADNTFTTDLPGYYGTVAAIGYNIKGLSFTGNLIRGYRDGVAGPINGGVIAGNTIVASNPLFLTGMQNTNIYNNTCISIPGTPETEGRVCVLGRVELTDATSLKVSDPPDDPPLSNTAFTANTVTDSSAWDLTNVSAGSFCIVTATAAGLSPTHWGIVQSTGENVVTVDKWTKVADSTIETPANESFAIVVQWAKGNSIHHNIFDGHSASYCFTFDFNPTDGWNYIDYNCYRPGTSLTSAFGNLGTDTIMTLAEQQAKWLVFSDRYPLNDAHSIDVNPGLALQTDGTYKVNSTTVRRLEAGANLPIDTNKRGMFGSGGGLFGN